MTLFFDILQTIFSLLFIVGGVYFVYQSAMLIQDKKDRQKAGLTDYYDNPIEKKDENDSR